MLDYQDYRYILQDTGALYVGARFSFGDIAKEEEIPFKFRSIMMRHILQEVDQEDTFESIFYYMKHEGYAYEVFAQLRTKVKVSQLTEVKHMFGRTEWIYKEHVYKLKEFVALSKSEKEKLGIVVQEIQFSKLAIMTFSV
ncbi:MAG: hypothetical protein IKK59_09130 [Lachnospiraceae bacterium]|nr:hypothetical protein [Lachnospiraceae bacterium]